jgi:hypothetical protein
MMGVARRKTLLVTDEVNLEKILTYLWTYIAQPIITSLGLQVSVV